MKCLFFVKNPISKMFSPIQNHFPSGNLADVSYPDISVDIVLDLSSTELLLERGLGRGVQHLVPDAGRVWRPADQDPTVDRRILFVQSEKSISFRQLSTLKFILNI